MKTTDNRVFVERLRPTQAELAARLIKSVIEAIPYYNERAKHEETAKYGSQNLLALAQEDPDSVLLALISSEPVGFCLSRYDDGLLWLSWFGVMPSYRRRGIGKALLDSLALTAPARRAHKLWCDTRTENIQSATLLANAGFEKICELRNHWYGQDFYLWQRPL